MQIKVNEDKDAVEEIRAAIVANDGYCPCAIEKTAETKCICKAFMDMDESGYCHCGLYQKII